MKYKIIGHRGNKAEYLENTLEGFKSILESPEIDGIEFDVAISKDGKLFISHDLFLKSDGKVVFLHTLTYKEILNFSDNKKKYPLLVNVLELCSHYKNLNNTILIELKSWPAFDMQNLINKNSIVDIHKMLYQFKLLEICYLISFDYRLIEDSYHLDKRLKTGLILHRNLLPLTSVVNTLHCSILVVERSWITVEQVEEMNLLDIQVFVWTPNNKKEWIRLEKIGVSSMVTDKPKLLSEFIRHL